LTSPPPFAERVRFIVQLPVPVGVRRAASAVQLVRLLVSGAVPPFRQTGEWLELTVPSILAHEVIAVDLA